MKVWETGQSSASLWPGQNFRGSARGGQGPVLESALTAAVLFLRCLQDGAGDVGFMRHMTVSGKCCVEEESRAFTLARGTDFCLKVFLHLEMGDDKS